MSEVRLVRKGKRMKRLPVPDARSVALRLRIAEQVRWLDWRSEDDALTWIEAVSEFDEQAPR